MNIYELSANLLDGTPQSFAAYRGRLLLIVNVASRCGLAPQYAGLEELYQRYRDRGLVVLGFPCNQFLQEPGDAAEIQQFCSLTYGVSFPIFAKIEVNGPQTHPLYALLKTAQPGLLGSQAIKWNFTKFLVDRDGTVLRRYSPYDTPEVIEQDLLPLLDRDPVMV